MKEDRRVRYTRMALRQSLLELMRDRPVSRITVKEICERADVNRSTFYVHYASPEALLDSVKKELYDTIAEERESSRDMRDILVGVCEAFQKHRDLIRILVRSGSAIEEFMPIFELYKDDFLESMTSSGVPRDRLEMAYLFLMCGASAIIVSWALGAFRGSAGEIAAEVYRLIDGGLSAYYARDDRSSADSNKGGAGLSK